MTKKVKGECFPGIRFLLLYAVILVGLGIALMTPAMASAAEVHFSIPEGEYDGPQTVVLTCDEGWKVCYTTDGTSPIIQPEGALYSQPNWMGDSREIILNLAESTTVRAVAYRKNNDIYHPYEFSEIASQSYQIKNPGSESSSVTIGGITFSVSGGNYTDEMLNITLSCVDFPGGRYWQKWYICYTTDGSDPVEQKPRALGPWPRGNGMNNPVTITVSSSTIIKAVMYRPSRSGLHYDIGDVATQTYIFPETGMPIQSGPVTFSPRGGIYHEPQDVHLSTVPEYIVDYALGEKAELTSRGQPIHYGVNNNNLTVSESCIVRAISYKEQDYPNFIWNGTGVTRYYIIPPGAVQVGEITFSSPGGIYTGAQEISLSSYAGDEYTIFYTTDGSDPTTSGQPYNGPITISESCTVRAIVHGDFGRYWDNDQSMYIYNSRNSDISEQTYHIVYPTYTLSLSTLLFGPVFEGYSQPETLPLTIMSEGNSDATITSVSLSGPHADCFTLNRTDGTTIVAGDTDDTTYTIQPAVNLQPGKYSATVTVTYDGGEKASSEVYFTVNEWNTAAVPVITPASGSYQSVQWVTISCETEGSSIYYTTDGTEPDSAVSSLYTGPIPVFSDTTIRAIAIKPGQKRSLIAEAAYTLELELLYGENNVFLGAEYQPVSFAYTPEKDGAYRFFCEDGEISPSITVWDGDDQISYQTAEYQPNNRVAVLTGGKEYTVKIESLHGTGDITVRVNPTTLYNIYADSSVDHGTVTVSQGALPVSDGALGRAYAGAEVYFSAEPEEGYGLADFSVINAIGTVISREPVVTMPWGDVKVRPHFDTVHMLSWPSEEESDEHANLEVVWINDGGMGAWGEGREVVRGQTVGLRWTFDDGYDADAFTLVTAGGTPVDWTYAWDNDNKKIIQFTMPGEDVYTAMTSRSFSFVSADFVLPSGTLYVEQSAFEDDTHITSAVIPPDCTGIGKWAFRNCANLRYILIPANCAVGEDAFEGCDRVYIYGSENSPAWQYCQDHDNCIFVEE